MAALRTLHRVLRRRTLVFLASDFMSQGSANAFRLAAPRHDLIAICSQDAWEREIPNVGALSLRDPDTGALVLLETAKAGVRDEYHARMSARADELRRAARRAGADWIDLTTAGDHLDALRRFFQMRERRLRR
jgi:hypothetical protein